MPVLSSSRTYHHHHRPPTLSPSPSYTGGGGTIHRPNYRSSSVDTVGLISGRSTPSAKSGVVDSVAELREKYSPANYVPMCKRIQNLDGADGAGDPIGLNRISVADLRRRFDHNMTFTDDDNGYGLNNNGSTNQRTIRITNYASYITNNNESSNNGKEFIIQTTLLDSDDDNSNEHRSILPKLTSGVRSTTITNSSTGGGRKVPPSSPSSKCNTTSSGNHNVNNNDEDFVDIYKATTTTNSGGGSLPPKVTVNSNSTNNNCHNSNNCGLNGLKNIGNTCFMNSVIQCLSNTRPLLEYVRNDGHCKDLNTSISSMKGALIKAFADVIKELWEEDHGDVVNTVSLKSQIQRYAPRFIGYAQQDAQEFLRYLLEGLHEDVNRVIEKPRPILTDIDDKLTDAEKATESWSRYLRMDNSRIVDCFVGQLKSTLKCTHCGHCSVTFDPFWDLSLPIPQSQHHRTRLSQCLDAFTREETLDGDEKPTCSRCRERRKCTKSFTIQRFPQILVLHLKRFSPTERYRGKLSVTIDFPLEDLDMSQYGAEAQQQMAQRYNLYAVSNHSGTTYSGHYTAYCRHPYKGTWHEYNDSRVSSIGSRSVVSGEAYVLFYEQQSHKSHL